MKRNLSKKSAISTLIIIVVLLTGLVSRASDSLALKSPDTHVDVSLEVKDGRVFYSVQLNGKVFLEESPLGLLTSIGNFTDSLSYVSETTKAVSESYELDRAKVSHVNYQANEGIFRFVNPRQDTLQVIFRVSNNDVAFCYKLIAKNRNTMVIVNKEATGFNLPDYSTTFITPQSMPMIGWEQTKPSYEEVYTYDEPVGTPSQYGVGYTFPALFKVGEDGWVLISETGVDSRYVGSRLGEGTKAGLYPLEFPQTGENNGMGGTYAAMAMPAQTPWRTITLGATLKPIVETTVSFDLVKQVYEPSIDYKMGRATWSWIVWQDQSINYDDQVKFIDMAAELNFEYVLIDNWWDQSIGRKRMAELVQYAKSKNVGIILWYNSNGYWNNAPQTPQECMNTTPARIKEMRWMQEIGVKGIKVDFFGGDKQETMKLYEDILADANEFGIAVTFHGCTLPRGWQRMYPNFVTSEAVLASENLIFRQDACDTHAHYATILPFTRNAVAAMDYAPVFFNKRLSRNQDGGTIRRTTDAFELATGILYFSPVQHFGLTPNNLDEQPDYVLDFIRQMPTVWDETVFIDGYLGKYVVLARRKGRIWYVSAVNGEKEAKELTLDLPMLEGQEVNLIYDNMDRTAGSKSVRITNEGKVKIELLPEGGAILFSKTTM